MENTPRTGTIVGNKQQKTARQLQHNYPLTYSAARQFNPPVTDSTALAFLRAVEANEVNKVKNYIESGKVDLRKSNVYNSAIIIVNQTGNRTMALLIVKSRNQIQPKK